MGRWLIILLFAAALSLLIYSLRPRVKPLALEQRGDIEMARTVDALSRVTALLWEIQGRNPVRCGGPPYDQDQVKLMGGCGGSDDSNQITLTVGCWGDE